MDSLTLRKMRAEGRATAWLTECTGSAQEADMSCGEQTGGCLATDQDKGLLFHT